MCLSFSCFHITVNIVVSVNKEINKLVLCKYSKFWIESSSCWLFDLIQNQSNYSKYLSIYLNVTNTRKGLCLCKKMWLSVKLLLTLVLNLGSSWSFYIGPLVHYGPPSTGRIQQLACNTNHKQDATKLLKLLSKYLLMVTFENGTNYSIQFALWFKVKKYIFAQY